MPQVDLSVKEAYCIGVGFGMWLRRTGVPLAQGIGRAFARSCSCLPTLSATVLIVAVASNAKRQ